ncbi:MAG: T9SS type A sorting domain-containing protein [Chitinophagales bacterium]
MERFKIKAWITVLMLSISIGQVCSQSIWINNKGTQVNIKKGTGVGIEGNLLNDSTGLISNWGIIGKADFVENYGIIDMRGDSASLSVDSSLQLKHGKVWLNSSSLVIYNSHKTAIQENGGIIIAERHDPEENIKWFVGEDTGTYTIPFHTGFPLTPSLGDSLADISLTLEILTAGSESGQGNLGVKTYLTQIDNSPYPEENIKLTDSTHKDISKTVVNRFWEVEWNDYTQNPYANITLKYSDADLLSSFSGTKIEESRLKAQHWNGDNWDAIEGTVDTANNLILIDSTSKSGIWVLVDSANPLYLGPLITPRIVDQVPGQLNSGSITLDISGGESPYSIHWSDGSTSQTKNNLNKGTYAVTVVDALSDTMTANIKVEYQIEWADTSGVGITGNSVEKTTSSQDFDAHASSRNRLLSGEDGYIEFTGVNSSLANESFYVGLSEYYQQATTMQYSFLSRTGFVYIYESGNEILLCSANKGNQFKIERASDKIFYYVNDTVIRSVDTDTTKSLRLHAGLGKNKPLVDSLRASFDVPFGLDYTVTDVVPGNTVSGAISLDIFGGKTPYSIHWADDPTSSSNRDSLDAGTYDVTVVDDNSDTLTTSITIGHEIVWKDTTGVTVTGNSISKTTAALSLVAGAASKNYLRPGENGYAEFAVDDGTNNRFWFGLSEQNLDSSQYTIEFAFKRSNDSIYIVESGRNLGFFATISTGDRFRLERVADSISYYKNNDLLRILWTDSSEKLLIDVTLPSGSSDYAINNISSSFGIPFGVNAWVTDAWPAQYSSGEIELEVLGGNEPFSYLWSNEDTSRINDDIYVGNYTATVSDQSTDTLISESEIGYKLLWQYTQNTATGGNSVEKTSTSTTVDAGAFSRNHLPANEDGYVEFLLSSVNEDQKYYIGLSNGNQGVDVATMDYALEVNNGNLSIVENGNNKGNFGLLLVGDVIRVEREGDSIRYSKNGTALLSSPTIEDDILFIDVALGKGTPKISRIKTNIGMIANPLTLYWVAEEDSLWSNVANWSNYSGGAGGAGVPDSFRTVIFNAGAVYDCYMDSNAIVNEMRIDSGYNATIDQNDKNLKIQQSLEMHSGIWLTGNGNLDIGQTADFYSGTFSAAGGSKVFGDNVSFHGGSFQGDSAAIEIIGDLSLYGGSFTSTEDTLTLGGGLTDTAYAFNHNDGTVIIQGSEIELNGSMDFYTLAFSDSNQVYLSTNDTIGIQYQMVLNDANILMDSSFISIANPDSNSLDFDDGRLTISKQQFADRLQWDIGNNTGTYNVPFYNNGTDVGMQLQVTEAGDTSIGKIMFSTYGTDPFYFPNNTPYPSQLNDYYDTLSTDHSLYVVDRFWLLDALDYDTVPKANKYFKYIDFELEGENDISELDLFATLWDGSAWDTLIGTIDTSSNKFSIDTSTNYGIWTLNDSAKTYDTGSECENAILINDTLETRTFFSNDTVMWFKFKASLDSFYFGILPTADFQKGINFDYNINRLTVYRGMCDSLILVRDSFDIDKGAITYFLSNLAVGDTYYVMVKQDYNEQSFFRFRLKADPPCSPLPPPSDIVPAPNRLWVETFDGTEWNEPTIPNIACGEIKVKWCFSDMHVSCIYGIMWYVSLNGTVLSSTDVGLGNLPSPNDIVHCQNVTPAPFDYCNQVYNGQTPTWVSANDDDEIIIELPVGGPYEFNAYLYEISLGDPCYGSTPLQNFTPPFYIMSPSGTTDPRTLDVTPDPVCGNECVEVECVDCIPPDPYHPHDITWTLIRTDFPPQTISVVSNSQDLEQTFCNLQPGHYTVSVEEEHPSCGTAYGEYSFEVKAIDFSHSISNCNVLQLTDLSNCLTNNNRIWIIRRNNIFLANSTQQNPQFINLPPGGNYQVCLLNKNNNYRGVCKPISIPGDPPLPEISGPTECHSSPMTYTVTNHQPGFDYDWVTNLPSNALIDGATPTGPNASIYWTDLDGGDICVTITDDNGCTSYNCYTVASCCNLDIELSGTFDNCSTCREYTIENPNPNVVYTWDIVGCQGCPTQILSPPADYTQEICWESNASTGVMDDGIDRSITISACDSEEEFEVNMCCEGIKYGSYFPKHISDGESVTSLLPVQGTFYNPYLQPVPGGFQLSGGLIFINGTFTIDQDLVIEDEGILFGANARLLIQDGVTLSIRSSQIPQSNTVFGQDHHCAPNMNHLTTLRAGCCDMWEGIHIEQGGTLIMDGVIIRDAYNAIVSHGNEAAFIVRNSVFHENLRHIVVEEFTGNHNSALANNILQSFGDMIPPAPNNGWTDIGIDVDHGGSVNIGVPGLGGTNEIIGAGIGINLFDVNANIDNNFIEGVNANQPSIGVNAFVDLPRFGEPSLNVGNLTQNTFINCNTGIATDRYGRTNISNNAFTQQATRGKAIHIRNSPHPGFNVHVPNCFPFCVPFQPITITLNRASRNLVHNNTINNGIVGIHLEDNSNFIDVNENEITMNTTSHLLKGGIWVMNSNLNPAHTSPSINIANNDIESVYSGIQLWNGRNATVTENNISIIPPNTTFFNFTELGYRAGINVVSSPNSDVECNIISGTSPQQDAIEYGIQLRTTNGTIVRCNDISDVGRSMNFFDANIGTQIRDNNFVDSWVGVGLEPTAVLDPQGSDFTNETFDNEWIGAFGMNTIHGYSNALVRNFPFFVRDNLSDNYRPGPGIGASNSGGLPVMPLAPEITSSNGVYNCSNSGCFIERAIVIGPLTPILWFRKVIQDDIDIPQDSLETRWWLRDGVYQVLEDQDSLIQTDTVLENFVKGYTNESLTPKLNTVQEKIVDYVEGINSEDTYEILVNELSNLNTTGAFEMETNRITYLESYLKFHEGVDSVSSVSDIEELAERCVFYGGPSVNEARMFMFNELSNYTWSKIDSIFNGTLNWKIDCSSSSSKLGRLEEIIKESLEESLPKKRYELLPNVYSSERNGQVKLYEEETGHINVYSVSGSQLISRHLVSGSNTINLNALSKGIYIYEIIVNEEIKKTDKIIIVQ